MAMVIDGTNGLTFNNATTQNSGGKVIQVVNGFSQSQSSTASASYVTTGVSASITPLFSTSKILITYQITAETSGSSAVTKTTVYRSLTNLATDAMASARNGGNYVDGTMSMTWLDSPATTSSTTYTIYINSSAGTTYWGVNNSVTSITLMEIAA
jgi:hypothetical protein